MMKNFIIVIPFLSFYYSIAQTNGLSGLIKDSKTQEHLAGASIILYQPSGILGGMSNVEGRFTVGGGDRPDSIRISMIGYRSRTYAGSDLKTGFLTVSLDPEAGMLEAVTVQPMSAEELVRKAAGKIPVFIPSADFEGKSFYREIIQDSATYYSVAEAIFSVQYHLKKQTYTFSLDRGRSREDVAYTRLFEDFHPGGGPEDALSQSLVINRPSFLDPDKLKYYQYKRDSTIRQDDQTFFVISFDQKPGVHESLEQGLLYINADDYSIVRYTCRNSPAGTPYIKSLHGSDKLFAELLHIDFKIMGWGKSISFQKINEKLYLAYAKMDYFIHYQQPKKNIDLNLAIHTETLMTEFSRPIVHEITREEEWKRKNLVANLPSDFDSTFWGGAHILDPTTELKRIIAAIAAKNKDTAVSASPEDWSYLNRALFVAEKKEEGIRLIPIARSSWDDEQKGGLLYKNKKGDFDVEAKLVITKRSNPAQEPDNGFQQSGIMIRSAGNKMENSIQLSLGTGGSSTPKYFLKNTIDGKTKITVEKTEGLNAWLRLEKKDDLVRIYRRTGENDPWVKWNEFKADWLKGELEVGFSVMARFAGDGPKQKPDMQALFSDLHFTDL
jgi:hypothetical protein